MSNTAQQSGQQHEVGIRVGFLELAPGITRVNLFVFFYSAFATIGLLTFVSTGTGLVLNANFGMDIGDQGKASGNLVIISEIVQVLVFGAVGVAADRIGRREVASVGMFLMGLGYLLYPFAETLNQLYVCRAVYAFGLGASAGMLQTMIADYSADSSRGKVVAITGICNGIGVIVITVLFGTRVPPLLFNAGFDSLDVSRITHLIVAGVCMLSAVIYWLGLKKGLPVSNEAPLPVKKLIIDGLLAARNPRIALSYGCAFVARSDQVVLGTFTVMWGTVVAIGAGIDPALAASKGAVLFAISSTAALLWLAVLGSIMDRLNRVTGVIICMAMSAAGYCSMLLVDDSRIVPLQTDTVVLFVLLGIGQISAFFGATTLISHEAPRRERGTVVGMYNTAGAIGIFFAAGVGGQLFDSIGPYAPFVLIGLLSLIVMLMAIVVRIKSPGQMPVGRNVQTPAALH
jgi:MFS family permease